MSAHNKPTDIEKKSNNAENVEMFFTTTEYVLVNGNNTAANVAKNVKKNSISMRTFQKGGHQILEKN